MNGGQWARVHRGLVMVAALMVGEVSLSATAQVSGYVWNEMHGEKTQALRMQGDAKRGAVAFEGCQGCHRAGALGRLDGSYPRLAGQHDTVLIKQMADVRSGHRENPRMAPFIAKDAISTRELADIAAYLQTLPSPENNGRGPNEKQERAAQLYERDCASCHGPRGQGNADSFYPRVAGQHYKYLLREGLAIRDGSRKNSDPRMLNAIKGYSNDDVSAVADLISRFATQSAAAAK